MQVFKERIVNTEISAILLLCFFQMFPVKSHQNLRGDIDLYHSEISILSGVFVEWVVKAAVMAAVLFRHFLCDFRAVKRDALHGNIVFRQILVDAQPHELAELF